MTTCLGRVLEDSDNLPPDVESMISKACAQSTGAKVAQGLLNCAPFIGPPLANLIWKQPFQELDSSLTKARNNLNQSTSQFHQCLVNSFGETNEFIAKLVQMLDGKDGYLDLVAEQVIEPIRQRQLSLIMYVAALSIIVAGIIYYYN